MSEQILALLFAERDRLSRAIEALGRAMGKRQGRPPETRNAPAVATRASAKPKRKLSAAGRKAIAEAARKRWALIKAGKVPSSFEAGKAEGGVAQSVVQVHDSGPPDSCVLPTYQRCVIMPQCD